MVEVLKACKLPYEEHKAARVLSIAK